VNEARPVDVRAELERLARLYRSKLGSELDQLKAQAAALNPVEPPSLELLQTVHRLAGSSLTFGHDALGGHLQQIEARIVAARAEARPAREVLAAVESLQLTTEGSETLGELKQPELESVSALSQQGDDAAPMLQPRTGSPRALLLDRYGWISPEIESVIQAYGFDTERVEADHAAARADLLIECTMAPSAEPSAIAHLELFLVCPRDGFPERMAAVQRGARALLPHPIDSSHLERRLHALIQEREQQPFRVVLLDDDAIVLQRHQLELRAGGIEVHAISRPEALFDLLERVRPDVLILDINLPTCSGLELARAVRLSDHWLQMPILYLSSQHSLELEALKAAGDEFLSKPISHDLLVEHVRNRAQRARALASGLSLDGLTGLLRSADARQRLAATAARARSSHLPLSIGLIDIDHFKQVNDTYGHAAGDSVLRALAGTLRRRVRGSDFVGRLGGEEFLVAFEDCTSANALHLLERLAREFSGMRFEVEQKHWSCTFSAGIADLAPGKSPQALLARADRALYRAKAEGHIRCLIDVPPPLIDSTQSV
jgi:diguanylate cyclase (GGDEF)-like protein